MVLQGYCQLVMLDKTDGGAPARQAMLNRLPHVGPMIVMETMLSLRCTLPLMPMVAALSANHLAALLLPLTLRRLYIARDADRAGDTAFTALTKRAQAAGRGPRPFTAARRLQ
jgi:hypothetical protein